MRTQTKYLQNLSYFSRFLLFIGLSILLLFSPELAAAGLFTVSPIKLKLDIKSRSGVIHVRNQADESLQIQVTAKEWTQDAEGKDQYNDTKGIFFFPRMITIRPKMERIIRVGIKKPPEIKERTYRLFVEEIPLRNKNDEGTQVQVAIKFGVPIFVAPAKKAVAGDVKQMALDDGQLKIAIQNVGNAHFVIKSILIRGTNQSGQEHFSKELSGWYLLPGSKRAYKTDIPKEVCQQAAAFEIEVITSEFDLREKFNVDQSLCIH